MDVPQWGEVCAALYLRTPNIQAPGVFKAAHGLTPSAAWYPDWFDREAGQVHFGPCQEWSRQCSAVSACKPTLLLSARGLP